MIKIFLILISYSIFLGPPCPKLLDCQFPKKKIEYIDPETKCMHRVCSKYTV